MSGEESRLSRWAKRKEDAKEGVPEKEHASPKRGGAAPVATPRADGLSERGFVKPMPALAEPEEGEMPYEAAPPDALRLLEEKPSVEEAGEAALKAFPLRREDEGYAEDESRELTLDEKEAVKDLPPIESLKKESDFTPFFAPNIPDFLKRQAYKALWMSSPFFAFRDGLDDYDENFRIIDKLITAAGSDYKPGKGYGLDDDEEGDGEDDMIGEGEEEVAEVQASDAENEADNKEEGEEKDVADGDDKKRKQPRPSDVRPPDNAAKR
ncbi:MAG: DUF3306 domain-containing protein [Proteobacteria bacterium]|nr:DUF3306 domain-containing protein [Pseudomonadota bacterium]MDA1023965.1 DUF3306 domain-containing protein [Pseudomonadota bacterium]